MIRVDMRTKEEPNMIIFIPSEVIDLVVAAMGGGIRVGEEAHWSAMPGVPMSVLSR